MRTTNLASRNRSAQVWVETVIYALIGLIIIGIVLAVATPKIEEYKDKIIVEQTISALSKLDEKILEVREASYNRRIIEFKLQKGSLIFDCNGENITYILDNSRLKYSEPGELLEKKQGDVSILTEEKGKKYTIYLYLDYSARSINLTYDGQDAEKTLNQAPVPYSLGIENMGLTDDKVQIDVIEG